jgi:hypothetical protein
MFSHAEANIQGQGVIKYGKADGKSAFVLPKELLPKELQPGHEGVTGHGMGENQLTTEIGQSIK